MLDRSFHSLAALTWNRLSPPTLMASRIQVFGYAGLVNPPRSRVLLESCDSARHPAAGREGPVRLTSATMRGA